MAKKRTTKAATKTKLPDADGIPVYCSHTAIVPIESVIPNPANPNQHPKDQVELLAKIIAGQGWRNPIVVSRRSGYIVKGHCRLMAAQVLSKKSVPVDQQDYASEALEYADLVADNRIAELAEIDRAQLKDLLGEMDTGAFPMDLTGYIEADLEALMTADGNIDPALFEELDKQNQALAGQEGNVISIEVPAEHIDAIKLWLANGEQQTAAGMGKGVMKRCGLL